MALVYAFLNDRDLLRGMKTVRAGRHVREPRTEDVATALVILDYLNQERAARGAPLISFGEFAFDAQTMVTHLIRLEGSPGA